MSAPDSSVTEARPSTPPIMSPIGALSRMSPATILDALSHVTDGKVHDLSLELNENIPQGNPGAFVPFSLTWRTTPEGCVRAGHAFAYAAEAITGTLHVGTHIDGLNHVVSGGNIYGGHLAADVRHDSGFTRHGMETVPPIIGRAVFCDVARIHHVDALADGYEVTIDDLTKCLTETDQHVNTGDVVLVRTGKVREFYTNPGAYQRAQPGVGVAAAIWLYDQGMAVLGTDTTGTEPQPFPDERHTTHVAMLVERGVHLIENLNLDSLSADGVTGGCFFCLPLKITGATGSWVRPVLLT